jgi:hypothetical protein
VCTCSERSTPFLPRDVTISRSFLVTMSYVICVGSMVYSLSRFFSCRDRIFSKASSAASPADLASASESELSASSSAARRVSQREFCVAHVPTGERCIKHSSGPRQDSRP